MSNHLFCTTFLSLSLFRVLSLLLQTQFAATRQDFSTVMVIVRNLRSQAILTASCVACDDQRELRVKLKFYRLLQESSCSSSDSSCFCTIFFTLFFVHFEKKFLLSFQSHHLFSALVYSGVSHVLLSVGSRTSISIFTWH